MFRFIGRGLFATALTGYQVMLLGLLPPRRGNLKVELRTGIGTLTTPPAGDVTSGIRERDEGAAAVRRHFLTGFFRA
ncbi:MAG: hypothetical protein EON58_16235 [Alphaproteobacteria bacterium]|nr:MAG: hypothetical protein EON58_16235 [Alphaproteobacteria bacterium]